jgi:hypothetical protein
MSSVKKNEIRSLKLSLINYPALIVGISLLSLTLLFFLKDQLIVSSILLLIGVLMITHKQVLIINKEEFTVTVHRRIFFANYMSRTILLKPRNGKVVLVNSMNEVNGFDKKSNTFYNYDVLYRLKNNHTINIYGSTNEAQTEKVAIFISQCLNLELGHKTVEHKE